LDWIPAFAGMTKGAPAAAGDRRPYREEAKDVPMLTVGLTGGIACGKSVVARELARRGCRLLDSDRLARRLMRPGSEGWRRVVDAFGRGILGPGGWIDRRELGRLVFADPALRAQLDRLIHPLVLAEEARLVRQAEEALAGRPGIFVVEAALMIEAGSHRRYHRLVVVRCPEKLQIERLVRFRRLMPAEARRRVRSQMAAAKKARIADYRLDASGTPAETRRRAAELYDHLVADEAAMRSGAHRH
jgi:dephospho-CoA kinase